MFESPGRSPGSVTVPGVTTRITLRGKIPFDGCVPNLFADGDVIALLDQPCQIIFNGVIGDACQRSTHAFADRAGGQNNIQLAGCDLGIFIEGFVKIAEAKKEDGVRIIPFDIQILLSNGSDVIVGHGLIL